MTTMAIVGLALVVSHAAGQAQGRAVTGSNAIAIGIMRVDGLLIPLVTLQGGASTRLRVSDPEADNRYVMVPEAQPLEGRPWTLWRSAGGDPTEFHIRGRAIVDFGYHFEETWKTTFKGTPVRPGHIPVAKLGLATQGVIVDQPEDVVSQPDAASQRVGRLVSHLAHTKEAEMISADADHPLREQAVDVRASTVVRLTRLWRRRAAATDIYYFEAVKQYGPLPILATGWIAVDAGNATSRDVTSVPAGDVHKRGIYRSVLGIVPLRGRDFWIMESREWESEDHTVRVWPSGKCGWDEASAC